MVLHELISYENLRLIWWLLLGVLLAVYAVMDGFDLGVGMLLPFAGRTFGAGTLKHPKALRRTLPWSCMN